MHSICVLGSLGQQGTKLKSNLKWPLVDGGLSHNNSKHRGRSREAKLSLKEVTLLKLRLKPCVSSNTKRQDLSKYI